MAEKQKLNLLERAIGTIAPQWQLKRTHARIKTELAQRFYGFYGYEAATVGRRTNNWNLNRGDANAINGFQSLARLREIARDLVRNNPYAESALSTIVDHTVGWGIVAKPNFPKDEKNQKLNDAWKAWAESTACDADGRHDLYGLQKLVMRSVAESGEVLVRRRVRLLSDGLPLPFQLQVLEADMLDSWKMATLPNGGQIVNGIEFDPIGRRVAYWLFPQHPGATLQIIGATYPGSRRVPATEILHIYRAKRPGQVRDVSWFAPVIVRMKDFDEYEDATLMKQKIAACLAVITTDVDGSAPQLGIDKDDTETPAIDMLEAGGILNLPPGREVSVVQPPSVTDHTSYSNVTLRAIAAGLGLTYEDLTGDYTNMPFSAARMSRLRHWARVDDWRWRLLIPQFCDGVWDWAMQAAVIMGLTSQPAPTSTWTPPPMPMIDPDKEGLAIMRNVRAGIQTLYDAIRERGYDVDDFLAEYVEGNTSLDVLKIKLDSDARYMTQAGQLQGDAAPAKPATGGAA
jgi:lambda family phage portal protein